MKPRKYIYTLKSTILEKVIAKYIDYVSNPLNEWRQESTLYMNGEEVFNDGEGIKPMPLKEKINELDPSDSKVKWNLPKPRYDIAKANVIAVVDILYRRYLNRSNDKGFFHVPVKYLKSAANNYIYILQTLSNMLIIDKYNNYTNRIYDRTTFAIRDKSKFHLQLTSTLDRTTQKNIEKIDEDEHKRHTEKLERIIKATSSSFVERYNKSLSKLKIDKHAATEYINNEYNKEDDEIRKEKRLHTVYKITSKDYVKDIRALDENGRFYHIGTELQRDIKRFTNIAYSIDCKNSHPFLFTYILLKYIVQGTIETEEGFKDEIYHSVLYNLIEHIKDNNGYYNHLLFSDFENKNLKNSKLSKLKLAKTEKIIQSLETIQPDVWQYIYDVSEGKIWDMFVEAFHEDRTKVKQNVFASVMYSYVSKRDKKLDAERAKWVDMFKSLYPSVFQYINEIKQSLHQQCKEKGLVRELKHPHTVMIGTYPVTFTQKDDILLSMLLMRLESNIFANILTKLFNKRIVCFGIHDAVAVLKSKLTEEEIKQVMMNEYKKFGLIPTLSVDYYNSN